MVGVEVNSGVGVVKRAISKNDSKKKTKKRKRRGEWLEEQINSKKKIWGRDRLPI
jgi:hypothetical protein